MMKIVTGQNVKQFTKWCEDNHLQINPSKTKKIISYFGKSPPHYEPVKIEGENIEIQ